MKLGHFNKNVDENTRKIGSAKKILGFSFLGSLNTTFKSKFNPKMVTISKTRIIFFYFQKLTGEASPLTLAS